MEFYGTHNTINFVHSQLVIVGLFRLRLIHFQFLSEHYKLFISIIMKPTININYKLNDIKRQFCVENDGEKMRSGLRKNW